MKFRTPISIFVLFASAFLLMANGAAHADTSIQIQNAWARATPAGAQTGAVYLTIVNSSHEDDRLVAVSSDAAQKAEIHSMDMSGNMMHMAEMDDGIAVPAGRSVSLKLGHEHIMLIGLQHPLKPADKIHLTLQFEKAGNVPIDADVRPIGHE